MILEAKNFRAFKRGILVSGAPASAIFKTDKSTLKVFDFLRINIVFS